MELNGRRKIYTAEDVITEANILSVINNALIYHIQNFYEEDYLYWYRRGIQPILNRTKEVRPEICNKVIVNNADMVVTFKNGYFITKPASYVNRKGTNDVTEKVKVLNEFLYTSGKTSADNELVDWFHTVGLAALYVEPTKEEDEDTPYKAYVLDPRSAFVVYSLKPGNRPIIGANMVVDGDKIRVDAYTKDKLYRISGSSNFLSVTDTTQVSTTALSIDAIEPNIVGEIPIIEYQYNNNRMSAFECAISIMDSINLVESNRADGIEQFIQSLIVTTNVDFANDDVTANDIRQAGMINLKSIGENKADFKVLSEQLDQSQTQVTLDDLYEQMLDKCGVPSSIRDSGSTSDNVGAVYLRSGWAMADTHARNCEDNFIKSNRLFDKLVLKILKEANIMDLSLNDFELKVIRNDMNNLIVKTQAAMNMKELGLAPSIALERSGLSNDPLSDIAISKDYIEQKWSSSSTPEVQVNGTEDGKKDDETETKTEEKTVVVESEDKTDEQND